MALKSLAEIAFDAFQTFAPFDKQFIRKGLFGKKKSSFQELHNNEKQLFERIASRVEAEIELRQGDETK